MPGCVREDADLLVLIRPLTGVMPVRRVVARYTAWTDGRWQVSIREPVAVVIPGDAATPAVDALAAILQAAGGD